MILVTLGTQDKKFTRLLKAIDKSIEDGLIKDEVVVQAGYSSSYKSKNMKIFDLISIGEFNKLIKECDILITHGGVGSILTGLKYNKKVIAAPRLLKYNEHTNDHQLQIIENFSNKGYILELKNFNKLGEMLQNIDRFTPKKFKSNQKSFNNFIEQILNEYL